MDKADVTLFRKFTNSILCCEKSNDRMKITRTLRKRFVGKDEGLQWMESCN